jgi:hypothetical protein
MMAEDLETALRATMWLPRDRREVMLRTLKATGAEGRALLPIALATQSVPGVEFWNELCLAILPKDVDRRFTGEITRHGITVAGARTVPHTALRSAFLALKNADPKDVPHARAAFLALGTGVSLAHAHGIYVSATRKAQRASLPKEPPHLDGPVPELTVFETVEVALAMARLALSKKPHAEAKDLVALAERQLAWARGDQKKPAPASTAIVPATSKSKGPGFALARAALMEACNVDHVSARGTSIKSAVMHGLELGEEWWLGQLDEALMLADARAAWEKRGQRTSSTVTHLVWRGGDKTTRLWVVRMKSGKYALLAKLGRNWTSVEGDLESVAATVPDAWFARAMPVIEQRR